MSDPHTETAQRFVRALQRGDWRDASDLASFATPGEVPRDQFLARLWAQLTDRLGTFDDLTPGAPQAEGEGTCVDLDARFARSDVTLRIVLDAAQRVSGFWVRPPRPRAWTAPAYADDACFDEVEVEVGSGPALPGTLTLPRTQPPSGVPAVVLVHGSGPNDRDEQLGPNRPFKDLAWGLATRGIAVLRYDKRTHAAPGSLAGHAVTVERELVVDALAALASVRRASHVDAGRVVVLGHSLGGALAPEIARRDGAVAGVVLLAPGGARPMAEGLRDQLAHLDRTSGGAPSQLAAARPLLDALIARALPPDADALGVPASYWYDLDDRRALEAARALTVPLLALFGGRDYQVPEAEAQAWAEALADRPGAELHRFPTLDHLFREGTGMATPSDYLTRGAPVAGEVVDLLARWIMALPLASTGI
jgi:dienelactone hydrolase